MLRFSPRWTAILLSVFSLWSTTDLAAQSVGPNLQDVAAARTRAVNFLKTAQSDDGSWKPADVPGVSGLITYALLSSGVGPDDAYVDKALKNLAKFIQPDGGIYSPKGNHSSYETAICLMVFVAANRNGRYDVTIKDAERYLRKLQWDETESTPESDVKYGGSGYGRNGDRPDLSNTTFFLDALQAAGAKSDDPAVQKAVVFLSRCQNLESKFNTTPFAAKVNDGGFYYTPAAGGSSPAGTTPEGGLKSYGSMTYAGLKSMVYAGLSADDPRVKAATEWIQKTYTLTENPGMGQVGVFYYYMMFAKTFHAQGVDLVKDASGKDHDWRRELVDQLLQRQKENGSWLNDSNRWYEGDPDLVSAYSLIALKYCEPKPRAK